MRKRKCAAPTENNVLSELLLQKEGFPKRVQLPETNKNFSFSIRSTLLSNTVHTIHNLNIRKKEGNVQSQKPNDIILHYL